MIQFSAPGAVTFGASKQNAFLGQGVYFLSEKQPNVKKTIFKSEQYLHIKLNRNIAWIGPKPLYYSPDTHKIVKYAKNTNVQNGGQQSEVGM